MRRLAPGAVIGFGGYASVPAMMAARYAGLPTAIHEQNAVLGRATHVQDDRRPEFAFDGTAYVARESLEPGNWNIRMKATSLEGVPFEQRVVLHVES